MLYRSGEKDTFVDEMRDLVKPYPGAGPQIVAACKAVAAGEMAGKPLSGTRGLSEVTVKFRTMEFRVLYGTPTLGGEATTVMLALRPFRKNTRKTPDDEMRTAAARLAAFEAEHPN